MKKIMILLVIVSILFSFMLTGCADESAAAALDVDTIGLASLGSVMLPLILVMGETNGTYGPGQANGDLNGMIVSGLLVISGTNPDYVYTFTACGIDVDEPLDGTVDMTLGGALSMAVPGNMVLTYSDFSISGTMPSGDAISVITNGSLTIGQVEFTASLTLSGLDATDYTIVVVLSHNNFDPTGVTTATINGVDYTNEFATVLADVFS